MDNNEVLRLQETDGPIKKGMLIGEYQVKGTIARGGMGIIYAAIHPLIFKRVAIKVISRDFAKNNDVVTRFIMEARAVNEIAHENIVDIFSIGELEDGRHYLVMELLTGMNLMKLLDHVGRLPPDKILIMFDQLCDALATTHQKGFVHRDLKPDNVFVLDREPGPQIKILDFGIAKLKGSALSTDTRAGSLLGTPEYMSPEQCLGEEVDHRTDIYALGVILYEALTGERPFVDPMPLSVLRMHVEEPPRPPSEIAPVSPEIEDVVLTAMAKDPADRYQSTREMYADLLVAIQGREYAISPVRRETRERLTATRDGEHSADWLHRTTLVGLGELGQQDIQREGGEVDDLTTAMESDPLRRATSIRIFTPASAKVTAALEHMMDISKEISSVGVFRLDGTLIATACTFTVDPELVGSQAAVLLALSSRMATEIMDAELLETYVKTQFGHVVVNLVGVDTVLLLLLGHEARLGLILFEVRRMLPELRSALGDTAEEGMGVGCMVTRVSALS
jgi:serine/threonine protein kinase